MPTRTALAVALTGALALVGGAAARHADSIVVTSYADSGPGTLREALTNAKPSESITFDHPMTIVLKTPLVTPGASKGPTIDGAVQNGRVVISGSGMMVTANDTVIKNLDFKSANVFVHRKGEFETVGNVTISSNHFTGNSQVRADHVGKLEITDNSFVGDGEKNLIDLTDDDLTTVARNELANDSAVGIEERDGDDLKVNYNKLQKAWIDLRPFAAQVFGNDVVGARAGIDIETPLRKGFGTGTVEVRANTVTGCSSTGIRIDTAGHPKVKLRGNTVRNNGHGRSGGYGIEIFAAPSATLAGDVVEKNGDGGIIVHPHHGVSIDGEVVRDNGGPGIFVAPEANAAISKVEMGGNDGPGIDDAPKGVTPNDVEKTGNTGFDWPVLRYDAATGKIVGKEGCAACAVEFYETEEGERKGNPHNGEGLRFVGSAAYVMGGGIEYPADEKTKLTCDEAKKLTAISDNEKGSSEFSPDIECKSSGSGGTKTSTTPGGKKPRRGGSKGTSTHAGPRCTPGTWTSKPIQFTTPKDGQIAEYQVETPIPNSTYYAHRHGYTVGGCQMTPVKASGDAAPLIVANVETHSSAGALLTWRYEYAPFPTSPGPGGSPTRLWDFGRYCDVTVTDANGVSQIEHHCQVSAPNFGFRLPRQGYLSTGEYTWPDTSLYTRYWLIFTVQNRNGALPQGGEGASVSVKVTWKLR